jgi:hypothetical protein
VLEPDSRELAVLLNKRGILGKYLGRFADSERHYQRALAIYARHGEVASAGIAAMPSARSSAMKAAGEIS